MIEVVAFPSAISVDEGFPSRDVLERLAQLEGSALKLRPDAL